MATLFNNHPYISSSKFSANWHAIAIYVGMVVEYGHGMECVSLTSCALCQPVSLLSHPRFLFRNLMKTLIIIDSLGVNEMPYKILYINDTH